MNSTEAITPVQRGLTPIQKGLAMHFGFAMLWVIGMHQLLHSVRLDFSYLFLTWVLSIVICPAFPLPVWRHALSTFASAAIMCVCSYLFSRFWP